MVVFVGAQQGPFMDPQSLLFPPVCFVSDKTTANLTSFLAQQHEPGVFFWPVILAEYILPPQQAPILAGNQGRVVLFFFFKLAVGTNTQHK